MRRDTKLSAVLHLLLHMERSKTPLSSEKLAQAMDGNPAVVRRVLAGLRDAGYLDSEKGHGGGWSLSRPLDSVTLLDVHRAVGSPPIFAFGNRTEAPECLIERAVNAALGKSLAEAEALLLRSLGEVSLADLSREAGRRGAARAAEGEMEASHGR